ncbi:MAG: hypothetical protein ACRCY4_09645 [Brevinema sp.]
MIIKPVSPSFKPIEPITRFTPNSDEKMTDKPKKSFDKLLEEAIKRTQGDTHAN